MQFHKSNATAFCALLMTVTSLQAESHAVSDEIIADQRAALKAATLNMGHGPQSPRDLNQRAGKNRRVFGEAPVVANMSICDIHFHESAEHRGGSFTKFAGNGDGHGYGTGFKYDGDLSASEIKSIDITVGKSEHGDLRPGDTIEVHFVYSTADATAGPTLDTCLHGSVANPQLRVEAVVGVLVSDGGEDFVKMTQINEIDGYKKAPNLPKDLGSPIVYSGSTTGPDYNEKGSPFQVTWSVRPNVVKLDIFSVDAWLNDNPFQQSHAHGVRNLTTDLGLLSSID
ncbi:delta-class carbonic anhydrase [Pseudopelagicola sp. nBUS_20]|uniref:delta-class carbonic anhydrase n=1 Tax=Pseudopelagicola sp. nBUS_20 TaxID=3395317 RepID=UPI003EB9D856